MKPNLSKIGKWMKDNKCFIIGTIGVFVAEAGFLTQGVKEGYHAGAKKGYHAGAEDGANYVYDKVDPETQKILKEELIKDGCDFYD